MNEAPFISVIVVSYNYAQYLPRCLDALDAQTFRDFEVVLVNNGSTDNTAEFLESYIPQHPNLNIHVYVVEKNIGLPYGRNVGLDNARGAYVIFNDADDWMKPDCLSSLAAKAKETDADRIIGDFEEVDTERNVLRKVCVEDGQGKWFLTSLQSVLFRRSILEENHIRVPLETKVDDMYVNLVFGTHTDRTVLTHCCEFCYFVNPYSTSGARNNNKKWNSVTLFRDCLDTMQEVMPNLKTEQDRQSYQYVMQKQFYFFFLHNNRYTDYRTAMNNYAECRAMLVKRYPDYLKNPLIRRSPPNGDRRSGQKLVWMLSVCERLHLFGPMVRLFQTASKIKYLN